MVPGRPPSCAIAPAAAMRATLTQGQARWYQRRGKAGSCAAALPTDALGALPSAAAAAATAASLLTAIWLRRAGGSSATAEAYSQTDSRAERQQGPAAAQADPPNSAEAIWAAAWRGFALQPEQQGQQGQGRQGQESGAAEPEGLEPSSGSTGSPPAQAAGAAAAAAAATRAAQQQRGREQQLGVDEDEELPLLPGQDRLQRTPVLLLQGIRSSDRRQLMALCLAALEAQLAALPAGASMVSMGGQWRQLSTTLLALSSLAAAAAWLGYVPVQLLEAAAKKLASADPAVLQAAGLHAATAAVQQQAAAAAAAAGGSGESGSSSSSSSMDSSSDGTAIDWYCLDEKLQLYSSVLRLLACTTIEKQQQQLAAAAVAAGMPPYAAAGSPAAGAAAGSLPGSTPTSSPAQEATGAGVMPSGRSSSQECPARNEALLLLQQQQQQQQAGLPGSIRGWRATAAGARSNSQLLALAPAALQDMAVTAADAVAAAYLADAAAAGPAAASMATGSSSSRGKVGGSMPATDYAEAAAGAAAAQQGRQQQRRRPSWWPSSSSGGGGGVEGIQPATTAAAAVSGLLLADSSSSRSSDSSSGTSSSSPLEAGWWPTYVRSQLSSTRQLQRFANQVALNRWVQRRYRGVADIYEDRLRLFAITAGGRQLEARAAPMKRTRELGQLKGLRYAASLLLEAVDVLAPLLRALWRHASSATSWLLVRLVGRAVGLVRRGIQLGGSSSSSQAAAGAAAAGAGRDRERRRQQQAQRQGRQPDGGNAYKQQQRQRQQGGDSSAGVAGDGWSWQPEGQTRVFEQTPLLETFQPRKPT